MFWLGLLAAVLLTLLLRGLLLRGLLLRGRRASTSGGALPGPPAIPFAGNGHQVGFCGPAEFFQLIHTYSSTYGDRFRILVGRQLYIFFSGVKDVEFVLSSPSIIEKSTNYDYLKEWLGTGLLTSAGEKWKMRRKVITPAFHFRILGGFVREFEAQGDVLVQMLRKHRNAGNFDVVPYITRCTLDIMCEAAMGVSVNAQNASDSAYVKAVFKYGL